MPASGVDGAEPNAFKGSDGRKIDNDGRGRGVANVKRSIIGACGRDDTGNIGQSAIQIPAAAAAAAAALAAALISDLATLISEVLAALALEAALLAEALASPAEAAAVAAPLSMSVSVMLETVGSPSPSKPRSLDARSVFSG